ncbi:MAG: LAGLIDADG family homing endonuclease [bacterium]|nr:LAGLIDADG family homing endonuclease [bacterium]
MFPNRTKSTIVVKALSLELPSAKLWQPEEDNVLHKHFAERTKKELTKLLPKRSGLAILAQGERLGLKRKTNKPKLKVNESYFKKWSAKMAYILGFIFADGNITKVTHNGCSDKLGFGQNKKDIDILRKIKQELSAEQTLSIGEKYVHFSIHSQIIVDDLKKLEVTYRKSFRKTRGEIPKVPKKYIRDFIRGIVDGDGSIHFDKKGRQKGYPNLSICGRNEVMDFIRNHFLSKFNIYSKIGQPKKNGKLSNVFYICYRSNSAKTLIDYLYENANIYLERKFRLAKRCSKIEMKYRKNYTKEEKQIIQQFYHLLPKDEILLTLPNRS